jgi:hypothetical protein
MADKSDGDDGLDALFAASPREFVAVRARLAGELKAAGRSDEAKALAKLRRPTASVWAVNQLARRERAAVAELLALGSSLRTAERRLLRGGKAGDFMEEARAARQKIAALVRRAEALMAAAGQAATASLGRAIAQTLQTAVTGDDPTRAALAAGRLTHDLGPSSDIGEPADLSSALAASVGAVAPSRPAAKASAREEAASERQEAAAARQREAARKKEIAAADRAVAERRRAVDEARAAVEQAEQELRAAKDALVDAETAAAAARRQASYGE